MPHARRTGHHRPLAPCDPDRILDEELSRLPERLRRPLVLCLLADYTQDRAAAELGYTPRTLRRRLEQAKQLLRTRLEKRGLAPAVAATLVAGVGGTAPAAPDGLGARAVAAMNDYLTGRTSPPVVLANGVVQGMIARKLTMLVAVAAVGLAVLGFGLSEGWTRASAQQVVPAANQGPPPGMVPTSPAARAAGGPPAGRDAVAGGPVRVGQRYSFGTDDFTFMGGYDSVEVLEVEGQWVRVRLWEREQPARGEAFPWINLNQARVLIPRGPAKKEK